MFGVSKRPPEGIKDSFSDNDDDDAKKRDGTSRIRQQNETRRDKIEFSSLFALWKIKYTRWVDDNGTSLASEIPIWGSKIQIVAGKWRYKVHTHKNLLAGSFPNTVIWAPCFNNLADATDDDDDVQTIPFVLPARRFLIRARFKELGRKLCVNRLGLPRWHKCLSGSRRGSLTRFSYYSPHASGFNLPAKVILFSPRVEEIFFIWFYEVLKLPKPNFSSSGRWCVSICTSLNF